jgi:hypothetical protein
VPKGTLTSFLEGHAPTFGPKAPYFRRTMPRYILHTLRLLVLVAFMAGSSGWVLHRHWCPNGMEERLSLTGPSSCGMEGMDMHNAPPAKPETKAETKACCSKPAGASALPLAQPSAQTPGPQDHPLCARTDDGGNCCHDAQVHMAGLAPFVVEEPTLAPDADMGIVPLFATALARSLTQPLLVQDLALPPDRAGPPPPTAERLSLVQVYRL